MDVNPLKKIWQAGGVAVGTMILYSTDIATIEIAAAAGLDFVMLDVEHRPHNPETIHDLAQVARQLAAHQIERLRERHAGVVEVRELAEEEVLVAAPVQGRPLCPAFVVSWSRSLPTFL